MWQDHSTNECLISFCGGLNRAWQEGKNKMTELKRNIHNILKKDENKDGSKREIVELFYGEHSSLYRAYYDKLCWPYNKFLMFIRTCGKLSEYNFTTMQAYSTDGVMDGMKSKDEFIACFDQVHSASSIKLHLTTACENQSL